MFTVGQEVICINAQGSQTLVVGDAYTVSEVTPNGSAIKIDDLSSRFRADRFQDVDEYDAEEEEAAALDSEPYDWEEFHGCCGVADVFFGNEPVVRLARLHVTERNLSDFGMLLSVVTTDQLTEATQKAFDDAGWEKVGVSGNRHQNTQLHLFRKILKPVAETVVEEERRF